MTTKRTLETTPKKGNIRRDVTRREVIAACQCGRLFDNTGAAWSHARSSRHVVYCTYAVAFAFVPNERGRQ